MSEPFALMAALMRMDDATWRRHANPWSVWTRIPIAPLLIFAIYSRLWIGAWCLPPIFALLCWTWLNPRAFPIPERMTSWASRAVLGERSFLDRGRRAVPAHHVTAARVTTAIALAGVPPAIYGLLVFDPWATALGAALILLGKLWFVDRMVWLQDEMAGPRGSD